MPMVFSKVLANSTKKEQDDRSVPRSKSVSSSTVGTAMSSSDANLSTGASGGAWSHMRDSHLATTLRHLPENVCDLVAEQAREKVLANATADFVCEERTEALPFFDRSEILEGARLGQGAFFDVFEVAGIRLSREQAGLPKRKKKKNKKRSDGGDDVNKRRCPVGKRTDDDHQRNARRELASSHDKNNGRRYALKSVRESIREDPGSLTKFLTAVRDSVTEAYLLAAASSHPFIVTAVGLLERGGGGDDDDDGSPTARNDAGYDILMERLYGTLAERTEEWRVSAASLSRKFNRRAAKENRVVRVRASYQLAEALAWLHSRGVVYRDVKPENVGFDAEGNVKLLDLGLARVVGNDDDDGNGNDRRALSVAGSPRYMAPEVIRRERYGRAADSYSFGLLLWETMTLRKAFEGWPFVRLVSHANGKGVRLDLKDKALKEHDAKGILERVLNFDPDARPSSQRIAADLRNALVSAGGTEVAERDRIALEAFATNDGA